LAYFFDAIREILAGERDDALSRTTGPESIARVRRAPQAQSNEVWVPYDVKLPDIGEGIARARSSRWLVKAAKR